MTRGVGALEAERSRCADCGRTPLIGEHVHLYDDAPAARRGRLRAVPASCAASRRSASEIVRHASTARPCGSTARAA